MKCACGFRASRGLKSCAACARKKRLARRRTHQRLKRECLEAYGGARCAMCEYTGISLTLDHVDGGGEQHRKAVGKVGASFYGHLKKRGFPNDPPLWVLCLNCNWERHHSKLMERLT